MLSPIRSSFYEFMLKQGISPGRAEVVPSGVNVSMFSGKSGEKIRERLQAARQAACDLHRDL